MFGDMGNMMKQLGDLKKQMKELKKIIVEASSKNNEVTVKCNGEMKIVEVKFSDNIDVKHLPNLVRDTVNKALDEVKMKSVGQFDGLKNLKIPGLN